MYNNHLAKRHLRINISSNIVVMLLVTSIGVWQVPYLMRRLGVELYGMVPLVVSFVTYFAIFTKSIADSVSCFVSIHLAKDEFEKSNIYFNSAFFAIIVFCAILFMPVVILSALFSHLFQVPAGYEASVNWLFFYIISSCLINAITSPFLVSTFATHYFYLNDLVNICGRILRIVIFVSCFVFLSPSLKYFGLSFFSMALLTLTCSVVLTRYLTPSTAYRIQIIQYDGTGAVHLHPMAR